MITVLLIAENGSGKTKLGQRLERNGYAVRFRDWRSDWSLTIDKTDPDAILMQVVSNDKDTAEIVRRVETEASKLNIPVVTVATATGESIDYPNLFCTLDTVATNRP